MFRKRNPQTKWPQRPYTKLQPSSSSASSPSPPLGGLIKEITGPDFHAQQDDSQAHVGISDVELVASYNWVNKDDPEILVPGKPPLWTPLKEPRRLQKDAGIFYRDQNAAKFPNHPIEPAVVSIMQLRPDPLENIELFGCGSTLGNLLKFCSGSDKSFRMLVDVVGDTVHLIRRENSPHEQMHDIRGHGHTFPAAYTSWDDDVQMSKSHQRVLRYRLGGIQTMIRFEADGYLPPDEKTVHAEDRVRSPSLGDVDVTFNLTSVQDKKLGDHENLVVTQSGQMIPQDRVFDIKTRAIYVRNEKRDVLGDEISRLWLRQIDHFILAFHQYGLFEDIRVQDIKRKVKDWENKNQPLVASLASLLRGIMELAKEQAGGRCEIVYNGSGPLQIRKTLPDAGQTLSDGVRARWEQWLKMEGCGGSSGGAATSHDVEDESVIDSDSEQEDFGDYGGFRDEEDFTACGPDCSYCGRCKY